MLDARLHLGRVVTVVDAVTGADTLLRFAEASRQAAVADALVISKTDLARFEALHEVLAKINPAAERILAAAAADPGLVLFGSSQRSGFVPSRKLLTPSIRTASIPSRLFSRLQ